MRSTPWHCVSPADLVGTPPRDVGLARSRDIVAGSRWTDGRTLLNAEAYVRALEKLVLPAVPSDPADAPVFVTDNYRVGTGSTRGLALSATHQRGAADLSLAYAYTRAQFQAGDDAFPPRYERRHQIDAAVSLKGGRNAASARFSLGTGQPNTAAVGVFDRRFYDSGTGRWSRGAPVLIRGEHNGTRLPGYLRLDLAFRRSYERRWFGTDGVITPYLQVLNVLNTRNVRIGEAEWYRRPELRYLPQLPFLPTAARGSSLRRRRPSCR